MDNQDSDIFEAYRPFRNGLRRLNLIDSLYVVWGYSRNYTFNYEFPRDIEKPNMFNPYEPDLFKRKYGGLFDHELEFLQREMILNCDESRTKSSFKEQKHFRKLVNYLRGTLDDKISKKYINQDNIILEFNRIAHRQFKWQLSYGKVDLFRYYKIYSDEKLAQIIFNKLGLTTDQIFLIGVLLFGWTATNFKTALPFKSTSKAITNEMIETFLKHFSIELAEAKNELKTFQQVNENIFYTFNPLQAKPILIDGSNLICPIPLFIFWRITNGLYYSIVKENRFDEAYGNAFQNYVGDIINKSCKKENLEIFPEEKFDGNAKSTTDWIIKDHNSILFIECKTKRMRLDSKSSLEITQNIEDDVKKMASFIIQLYKTYIDYSNNRYPNLKFEEDKFFYPLVLTLEDWYININHIIEDLLKKFVTESFTINRLDLSLLEKFPYHIKSASQFERDIQLIDALGIENYFFKCKKDEIQDFIKTFEFKDINDKEYQRVFIDSIYAAEENQ